MEVGGIRVTLHVVGNRTRSNRACRGCLASQIGGLVAAGAGTNGNDDAQDLTRRGEGDRERQHKHDGGTEAASCRRGNSLWAGLPRVDPLRPCMP